MKLLTRAAFITAAWLPLVLLSLPSTAQKDDRQGKKWPELYESTKKEWVDYGENGETLSRVDFEKGRFEIQALIPVPKTGSGEDGDQRCDLNDKQWAALRAAAQEKIAGQAERMLSTMEPGMQPVMKDQILDPDDKFLVEAKHAGRFTHDHLIPQMVVEDKPVIAGDRKPRLRVKVQFDMIPDHMMVRARRYSALVAECARTYELEPALIYAIIHSESFFNPMSTSNVGALGLMQLTPGAASEAYKFAYKLKKERPVTAEYLYDPSNNIRLGSAYLHLLDTAYFGKLKSPEHRRTLCIAAYNCGPWRLIKRVLAKTNIDALSNGEVLKIIIKNVPRETKYYVPRVEERMALYQNM